MTGVGSCPLRLLHEGGLVPVIERKDPGRLAHGHIAWQWWAQGLGELLTAALCPFSVPCRSLRSPSRSTRT